jgi:hypothetical protein
MTTSITRVVVTGAAGSIVAAIVADLARSGGGGVFHLLDVAPAPTRDDPECAPRERPGGTEARPLREAPGAGRAGDSSPGGAQGIERAHAAATALAAIAAAGVAASAGGPHGRRRRKAIDAVRESGRIDVLLHAAA